MKLTKIIVMSSLLAFQAAALPAAASDTDTEALERFRITELMNRYAWVHNLTQPEEYADLFTEDGQFVANGVVIVEGREALLALAEKDREDYNPGAADGERSFMTMRTIITNPMVTLNPDGETASGECYVQIVVQAQAGGPQILAQGRYEDTYRKEEGEWRIATRETFLDMTNLALAREVGVIE